MPKRRIRTLPTATSRTASRSRKPAVAAEANTEDLPELEALVGSALRYATKARAKSTDAAYAKHWAAFTAWCARYKRPQLPASPKTVAAYLAWRANQGRKPATLALDLAAIAVRHSKAGHPSPTATPLLKETWKGIRASLGTAPNQKAPATVDVLRELVNALPTGILGVRDRALLTVGFAGGFRRSELVALDRAHLRFSRRGLEATVRRSKTDQEAKGLTKAIACGADAATCPVTALKDWLELARIHSGPVFRPVDRHGNVLGRRLSAQVVALVVKRSIAEVGLDPELFSGHSLRAGFVTTAKERGVDDASVMEVTGHQTLAMVHSYNRKTKRWDKPASGRLGL